MAVIHSSTSGYSPRPPVSVYGTGPRALSARRIFSRACLPALSARPWPRGTVGFQSPYVLQPAIPSAGGSSTPRSPTRLRGEYRNLYRFHIGCASRPPLSPRLTLSRLTSLRNPWACGAGVSTPVVVTHAYIFFSGRSSETRVTPSAPSGMLPYRAALRRAQSFGGSLNARSSSTQRRSTSELLRTL